MSKKRKKKTTIASKQPHFTPSSNQRIKINLSQTLTRTYKLNFPPQQNLQDQSNQTPIYTPKRETIIPKLTKKITTNKINEQEGKPTKMGNLTGPSGLREEAAAWERTGCDQRRREEKRRVRLPAPAISDEGLLSEMGDPKTKVTKEKWLRCRSQPLQLVPINIIAFQAVFLK